MEILLMIFAVIAPFVLAILSKTNPDLIFRSRNGKTINDDTKRFFFVFCIIFGMMSLSVFVITSIPALAKIKSQVSICIVMAATALMLFMMWRFNIVKGNGRFKSVRYFLGILLCVFMAVFYCIVSHNELNVSVNENVIEIDGTNPMTIPMSDIQSIRIVQTLPETESDSCCMAVEGSEPPYVEVRTDDKTYYLNKNSPEKTMKLILALENIAEDKFINAE